MRQWLKYRYEITSSRFATHYCGGLVRTYADPGPRPMYWDISLGDFLFIIHNRGLHWLDFSIWIWKVLITVSHDTFNIAWNPD